MSSLLSRLAVVALALSPSVALAQLTPPPVTYVPVVPPPITTVTSTVPSTLRPPQVLTLTKDSIAGRFYAAEGGKTGAAVLMVGGSDCGYPAGNAARDLAEAGHPVLALAYCSGFSGKFRGLPDGINQVPLEYIDRGFDWLAARVGQSTPIAMMGESRGAELALLYGANRRAVRAVIAFSPSSLTWAAAGDASGTIPAWTRKGRALPHVTLALRPEPGPTPFLPALANSEQVKIASIAVEKIKGPVLLLSSRADRIWPAAQMADRIEERLKRTHFRYPSENLQFDNASHLLMGPGSGLVEIHLGNGVVVNFGGTEEGTLAARNAGWAAAKELLASLPAK